MTCLERDILEKIKAFKEISLQYEDQDVQTLKSIKKLLKKLQKKPLNTITPEFINDKKLKKYIQQHTDKKINFWLLIADYYCTDASFSKLKKEKFNLLEQKLKEIKAKNKAEELLSSTINKKIIKTVYLSNDKTLLDLFKTYVPVPRPEVFNPELLPEMIAVQEKLEIDVLLVFLSKMPANEMEIVIAKIKTIQRYVRKKIRIKGERNALILKHNRSLSDERDVMMTKDSLMAASRPYIPSECSRELARKIYIASGKIKLFNTIHHITTKNAFPSILNVVYGRHNLQNLFLNFKPAALEGWDIKNGDGNVVCFAPYKIDPICIGKNSVDIIFDLEKMNLKNPCIFYKGKDLGYDTKEVRKVMIGGYPLYFSHTRRFFSRSLYRSTEQAKNQNVTFQLFSKESGSDDSVRAQAQVYTEDLISYNTKKMHQILTLNFFKFLDGLGLVA